MKHKKITFLLTLCSVAVIGTFATQFSGSIDSNAHSITPYNSVNQFIKKESQAYTTLIKPDIEKYLNEKGVFDSEIKNMSDDDIERLNSIESTSTIAVHTEYGSLNEETGETSELTNKEKIAFINEYSQNLPSLNKSYNTTLAHLGETLGIIPSVAYADTYAIDETETSGKKFKQTVIISSTKPVVQNGVPTKPNEFIVVAVNTWATPPKNRSIDVYGLEMYGLQVNSTDNAKAYGVYTAEFSGPIWKKDLTTFQSKNFKTMKMNAARNNLVTKLDLPNDGQSQTAKDRGYSMVTYKQMSLYLSAIVKAQDPNNFSAAAHYYHSIKKIKVNSLDVGISFPPSISIGSGASWGETFQELPGRNATAIYYNDFSSLDSYNR